MKKKLLCLLCVGILFVAPACSVRENQTEKIRDWDVLVIREENIPAELQKVIREKGMEEFRLTYVDQGELYIARGYGERKTTGYEVKVADCYETSDAVCIRTELLGPSKEEKVIRCRMNPYVVVRLEDTGKNVRFE